MEIQYRTTYYVCILTNNLKNLWNIETTTNPADRLQTLAESKEQEDKYLVYYEAYKEALDAVRRESRLLSYSQRKLKKLVTSKNPELLFLNPEQAIAELISS